MTSETILCKDLSLEAQQRYFSYRAILVAIVSRHSFALVFYGGILQLWRNLFGEKVKSIAFWRSLPFYSMLLRNRRPPKWRVSHKIPEKSPKSSAENM